MNSNPTPPEILEELMLHPLANVCWRWLLLRDHECGGRLTWEHALTHGGRRVNEAWAIIRICEKAHSLGAYQDCGILDKNVNRWIAFSRIEDWEAVEERYPRTSWRRDFRWLVGLYGRAAWPRTA